MKFIHIKEQGDQRLQFDVAGRYVVFFENISGKLTFDITSSEVELFIYGLYIGKSKDVFHIETVQRHQAPGSLSDLLIKGVFSDESKCIYQGLIRLEKEAQQSHAYQKNQNLILSPDSFVDSRPFLEILANDVFCTHGSTTGKLNKDMILYLRSRALSQKQAEALLINGFINEVYEKVQSEQPDFMQNHTRLQSAGV